MNTRIRKLKQDALHAVADEHARGDVSRLNTDSQHVKDLIDEKFAELVLIDVIDILSTYRVSVTFQDGIEYNCVHPIQAIEKHFGI